MIKLLESIPDAMKPFSETGKVDDIFRPRMLGQGIFATTTAYSGEDERDSGRKPNGIPVGR